MIACIICTRIIKHLLSQAINAGLNVIILWGVKNNYYQNVSSRTNHKVLLLYSVQYVYIAIEVYVCSI